MHANQAAVFLTGKRLEELRGQRLWDVFPALKTSSLGELLRQAMELGKPSVSEQPSLFDDSWREMSHLSDHQRRQPVLQ